MSVTNSLATGCWVLLAASCTAWEQTDVAVTAEPAIARRDGGRRYLAIDRTLHAECRNLDMVMGQASGHKLILEEFSEPWEKTHDIGGFEYCSVLRDHEGRFRLYYNVRPQTDGHEMLAVAFSNDGVNWFKPALNIAKALVDHPSSNIINVVSHPGMQAGHYYRSGPVFYDEHAPPESRYKLSWRVSHDVYVATSSDGLTFTTHGKAFTQTADTQHSAFFDSLKGEYVLYGRKRKDWPTGDSDRRGVQRHSSRNWTDIPWTHVGQVVIDPMDVWDYSQPVGPQVYTPAVQIYHGQYIGLPAIFFVDQRRQPASRPDRKTGTFYPMVMHSHDGIRWTFPHLSHPIIDIEPHKRISTYEHASFKGKEVGMVCTASNFLEVDDRLMIYYTHREANHYEPCPPDRSSIHLATMRVDGFGGIQARSDQPGEWVTSELTVPLDAAFLEVNAVVAGSLRVEVLDSATRQPIDGLGLAESVAFKGDKTSAVMAWGGDRFARAAGTRVRLRFVMEDGVIYSFSFSPRGSRPDAHAGKLED